METYAILGISMAVEFYGADLNNLYSKITRLLGNQKVDRRIALPTAGFPDEQGDVLQCPLCRRRISKGLEDFRNSTKEETWQPGWRSSKKAEGDDSSIQIMQVDPLVESEMSHKARNDLLLSRISSLFDRVKDVYPGLFKKGNYILN